jgi:hypothetical protein
MLNWYDHGLQVKVGDGARRRFPKRTDLDLFVHHTTGGENPPRTVFDVLDDRELGVEFITDHEGVVWQFADPIAVDTFDAGRFNRRSIGNEIINYLFGKPKGRLGQLRDTYRTRMNGQRRTFARSFPAQLNSAFNLTEAIIDSGLTKITRNIPYDANGDILRRTMSDHEVDTFTGVLGHFHLTRSKSDPGTDIFEMYKACGY